MNRAGRYEICGRLGRGGMGTVYKARAPVTGRIVALKILKPRDDIFEDLVGKENLKRIFLDEARIMGRITHDHVAKVIDCDEHEGTPFIVLEYYSHSLGDFIGEAYRVEQDSRIVSVPRTVLYMRQALQGLERLHFAGIIHRDIKPYNILITSDDRVKLIDFGLSRVRGEELLSIPGMQVGSPYYAAPEQEKDPENVDGRADLFSLGVMMYRMLTGKLVEPKRKEVIPPSRINSALDGNWDRYVLKCLSIDPGKRHRNALEMRVALEGLYDGWKVHHASRCPLPATLVRLEDNTGSLALRSEPKRLLYKEIRELLGLDELFRPVRFFEHNLQVCNPLLLYDPVTGLYWQRSGTGFTVDRHQAREYVEYLNAQGFQGRSTWRLPTTEELVTILRPPTVYRDFCIDSHFDPALHWLWSSDTSTKKQAWMADIVESHIARQDLDGTASVCAVSE